MAYAQKNYGDILGNGPDTIAEDGCLLTAIANLLSRFKEPIEPPELNKEFISRGLFDYDPISKTKDYLDWATITKYDPTISYSGPFTGSMPPTANAIVKFHYNSVHTGQPIDHYCLIDHIDGNQVFILDSWDGLVKAPAQYEPVYHNIVEYCAYIKAPTTPLPSTSPAPSGPKTSPSLSDTYEVLVLLDGYLSSSFAATHANSNSKVSPGVYYVFNRYNGMINITRVPGQPGWWINPADNVLPSPSPTPPAPAPATTTPATAPTVPDWRTTYRPFTDAKGNRTPIKFIAVKNYDVTDLEERKANIMLPIGWFITIGGTFEKDGIPQYRPQEAVEQFSWYGVPEEAGIIELYVPTHTLTFTDYATMAAQSLADFFRTVWNALTFKKG